jgi:ParD-like antitoxin of type II ParDE toxin-antitoxin system
MPTAVKVSEKLLTMARQEAHGSHRSITAQIEHWATIGRAVEVMLAYRDVLALKRTGTALPLLAEVSPAQVHDVLVQLGVDTDREGLKARLRRSGAPLYETDPKQPGLIFEVLPDGTRRPGRLQGRRFVPLKQRMAAPRKAR